MAIKVDDVARAALAATSSNAGLLLAISWCSERYRQLSNRTNFRHLRQVQDYTIPAAITDGTVTATRGESVIVGDATARTAWTAQDIKTGHWYIRVRRNWYKVVNQTTDGDIVTQAVFAEDDVADVDYTLVKRFHSLITTAPIRKLGKFVHPRLHRPLAEVSHKQLDLEDPSRWIVAGYGPEAVCEVGNDPEGRRVVEFHPFSTREELVSFVYWPVSPDLRPGTLLPADLDLETLKVGVLIDVYRFEMMRAMRDGKMDAANTMANMHRSQETKWEDAIQEAISADRSVEDLTFILHTRGPELIQDNPLIRTAAQDSLSRLSNWP